MTDLPVYDNYEISGCLRDGDEANPAIETCDDAEAQFWTLYGHIDGQGVEAIGDFNRREAAETVFFRITGEPFTGSYQANPRLRMMHAASKLLAACQMVVARWERGNLSEAARACQAAIALATASHPQREITDDQPIVGKLYSVLLLYPDYANDSGTETYLGLVEAADPAEAVAVAQRQAAAAQEGVEMEPGDFAPLLVTLGHHTSEPLFNH
jgi:hypothetical protein